ncbi:MAG: RNA polymerase sigma factor [Candidatus Hydrogenedentes bacterium]|nr:RNA polymerase sigma factor [Candidatus Hydrogenedentota bacterium]
MAHELTLGWEHLAVAGLVAREDADDIGLSLAGDEAAFGRLIDRYEGLIGQQMWRFTRDRATHEELVQEVFVQAYLSLKGFRGQAPFEHWLRRIATRTGYRFWQEAAKRRGREAPLDALPAEPSVDPPGTASEAAEYLFVLLETLAPQDRLVLTLHYFEQLDTQEIADRMGWSRTLVKVRAHRARAKLRRQLEAAGYGG